MAVRGASFPTAARPSECKPLRFGRRTFRSVLRAFQRSEGDRLSSPALASTPSTECEEPFPSTVPLRRISLSVLCDELKAILGDRSFVELRMVFDVSGLSEPRLELGESAVVTIDSVTGLFAFWERGGPGAIVVISSSEERIIDQVISHIFSRNEARFAPQSADQAASMLVGHTLADVERRLIVHTLRHCHGSHAHCATLLNLTQRELRGKIREYFNRPQPHAV